MKIKIKLRELRKKLKMSQQKVADFLGVHQTVISDYEMGIQIPSVERLIQLAQVLDVTLDDLVLYERVHKMYNVDLDK